MKNKLVWIFLILGILVGAGVTLLTDVNVFVNMIIGALAGAAVGYFLQAYLEKKRDK